MQDKGLRLTEFGATVRALMAECGLTQYKELANLMNPLLAGEKKITPSKLSNWFHGRHSAPVHIPRTIAEALQLDEEKCQRLANAYSYGQDVPVKDLQAAS